MKTLVVSVLLCAMMVLSRTAGEYAVPFFPLYLSTSCPNHWTEISGRCFRYVANRLNWGNAEKNCIGMGAHLASVHSANEYQDIQKMIVVANGGFGRTWLGGSDCQTEGIWLWSDGTVFDYKHCGKFDNRWWKQHCLQMNYGEHKCWDDVQCSSTLPSVCAKKVHDS
uniref:C-type lectin domain-containing protein n=1 Tax=Lates calcarifer TaxID=8187 RepID=A0A4W6CA73_LATCA